MSTTMGDPAVAGDVFPSKVDRWVAWVVGVGFSLSLTCAIVTMFSGVSPMVMLMVGGGEALALGFVIWIFTSTYYAVRNGQLIVRSGPFGCRIDISKINEIVPTRNPLSSPALSLDRLDVRYGNGKRVMISPRERQGFLQAIVSQSQGLVLNGDRVDRPA